MCAEWYQDTQLHHKHNIARNLVKNKLIITELFHFLKYVTLYNFDISRPYN